MALSNGVQIPQLGLGTISLPKTSNPDHMKSNAEVDFEISAEDMEILKNFKKIESYGASSGFPVYGGDYNTGEYPLDKNHIICYKQ